MRLKFIPQNLLMTLGFIATGVVSLFLAAMLAKVVLRSSSAQESEQVPPPLPDETVQAETLPAGPDDPQDDEDVPLPPPLPSNEVNEAADATAADVGESSVFLEPYLYDIREGRRNPFVPPLVSESVGTQALAGPTGPLERYELDDLKLVAIMWDVKKPRALIIDPNKIVHTAYKDERIGRRRGYIAVIRESELVVVEPSSFDGETVYSTRILRIGE